MLIPVDIAAISSFYFVNQKPLLYFFMIYFRQLRYWEAKSLCVHFSGKIVSHFLCESDWYWLSSTLASRFWTKESPSNQNLPYIMLKTRFPFLYASTSLDTKTVLYKTLASIRHFESCMLIRCPPPQHILQFFQNFPRVFSLPLATLFIIVLSSLTFHLAIKIKKKKKTCLQWVSLPRKSWSIVSDAWRLRCPIGIGGEIISWRGATYLRTLMS